MTSRGKKALGYIGFFWNTPSDWNHWVILYLKLEAQNDEDTCIMLVVRKNIMCFQSSYLDYWIAEASGKNAPP